ncbi:MAG: BtpA/SgcQ family protein [Anaerolineae bacterium]|nr:BtpA/SgcQ family protein [Anaerolineae bacterium]MCA9893517.1 BtpA/SgcQ family protein [Anaerolineae bacterium]
MSFESLFKNGAPIVGMVHLLALPETPDFGGDLAAIYTRAEQDTAALIEAGVDALIIENFGDEPYFNGEPTAAQFAVMAHATTRIRQMTDMPIGINVQFNAWQAEVALAYACGAQFMRVEVFVDTVISAQGQVAPCSAQITRYRRALGATNVQIWADIQTKYTQNVLPQPITQSAIDATNAGADAIIVTGGATGQQTPLSVVEEVKNVTALPVLVGSGTTLDTLENVLQIADGAIVGSSLKEGGHAVNPVSLSRTQAFMDKVRQLRG